MRIRQIIDGIRASMAPRDAVMAILELAAQSAGSAASPSKHAPKDQGVVPLLRTAAGLLMGFPIEERFAEIEDLLDSLDGKDLTDFWIRKEAAQQLVEMLGKATEVRFHYPLAMRPCLAFAQELQKDGRKAHLAYVAQGRDRTLLEQLAAILELKITITERTRWDSEEKTLYTCELIMPPARVHLDGANSVSPAEWHAFGFARSQGGRASYETLSLLNALSRIKGRIILAVSETLLSRAVGLELIARQKLLVSHRLQAVFGLPAGMMLQGSQARSGLLVLGSLIGTHEKVRMVDLGHPELAIRRARGTLQTRQDVVWRDLIGQQGGDPSAFRDVRVGFLDKNSSSLWPERYLTPAFSTGNSLIDQADEAAKLQDLVDFVRPQTLAPSLIGEYRVFEVGAADIDRHGNITMPRRVFHATATDVKRYGLQALRPGDVLISIKGTIGVVGLVRQAHLANTYSDIWMASPALMILRAKDGNRAFSIIVSEYLASDVAQQALAAMAAGATVKTISAADLKGFPVPLPNDEQMEELVEMIHRREAIEMEIARLELELEALKGKSWPASLLPEAANGT